MSFTAEDRKRGGLALKEKHGHLHFVKIGKKGRRKQLREKKKLQASQSASFTK